MLPKDLEKVSQYIVGKFTDDIFYSVDIQPCDSYLIYSVVLSKKLKCAQTTIFNITAKYI